MCVGMFVRVAVRETARNSEEYEAGGGGRLVAMTHDCSVW